MASTLLEVFGALAVIVAAFTVGVTVGIITAGIVAIVAGVMLERQGR